MCGAVTPSTGLSSDLIDGEMLNSSLLDWEDLITYCASPIQTLSLDLYFMR